MKKSTSKNEACYFLAKSNALKLKEELGIAYAETFQKGYSVVEIARYTGSKTCKYIHASLGPARHALPSDASATTLVLPRQIKRSI